MVVAFFLIGRTSVSIRTLLELLDKRGPVRPLCSPVDIFLQVDFHSGSVSFQPHSCPFSIVNITILPTILEPDPPVSRLFTRISGETKSDVINL